MPAEERARSIGRVDPRQVKLQVGVIAILLPVITSWTSPQTLNSISESYWEGGSTQSIFVGGLFSIAALMLSYDGVDENEARASKLGALCALLVALYPCVCIKSYQELIRHAHALSAGLLYVVLAYFCLRFMRRAKGKGIEGRRRYIVYVGCFATLTLAMVMLLAQDFGQSMCTEHLAFLNCVRYVWFWESVGLVSFGIAWFNASHLLPWFNAHRERLHLLKAVNVGGPSPDAPGGSEPAGEHL
jgi:uncharacterized membrane protein